MLASLTSDQKRAAGHLHVLLWMFAADVRCVFRKRDRSLWWVETEYGTRIERGQVLHNAPAFTGTFQSSTPRGPLAWESLCRVAAKIDFERPHVDREKLRSALTTDGHLHAAAHAECRALFNALRPHLTRTNASITVTSRTGQITVSGGGPATRWALRSIASNADWILLAVLMSPMMLTTVGWEHAPMRDLVLTGDGIRLSDGPASS